ncbi:MAG: hypothetical protein GC180_06035 [Bacteroidetes bacterium]|nr:hypothetical protein [Bacteroidota bacterium]
MKRTHFDPDEFLKQTAGNQDIASQVAALYHNGIQEELSSLQQAFDDMDLEAVRRKAHKFKSGFIIMGAKALYEKALGLEKRSKSGEKDLQEDIDSFREACEGLDKEVSHHFNLKA